MEKILKKKELIIFILLIAVAITVRIIQWPTAINDVNCDEIMTAINAKSVAEYGTDMYGTSLPVYFEAWKSAGQSAMLGYLMAVAIKLFGCNIFAIRLPMLLVSILSILVMFDFIRRIFKNNKLALTILAILAINPWHILQSIWSLDCNMFPHFVLFGIYFLYLWIDKKKNMYLYLSMILFGLTMYTYGVALYFVPAFLVIIVSYLLYKKEITISTIIKCVLIYLVVSLPFYLMILINFLGLEDIKIGSITIQHFLQNSRTKDNLLFSDDRSKQLIENIKFTVKMIFKQFDGLSWNAIDFYGAAYPISFIFVILAIPYKKLYMKFTNKTSSDNSDIVDIKNKNILIGRNLIFIWLIASIITGIFINDVNINRLNIIWYPLIMLFGKCIYDFCNKFNKWYKVSVATIVILVYAGLFLSFAHYLYTTHVNIIAQSGTWSNGLVDAVQYADNLDKDKVNLIYYFDKQKIDAFFAYGINYDMKYINNQKTVIRNGKELLPYSQRYNVFCGDIIKEQIDIPNDSVYVVSKAYQNYIDKEKYNYKEFKGYYVVY